MKKVEVCVIDYYEFDSIVKDIYEQDYSFVNDMDMSNDTDYLFLIDNLELDSWEIEKIKRFKSCGEGCFLARSLLKDLIRVGKLEKSNYIVRVSW